MARPHTRRADATQVSGGFRGVGSCQSMSDLVIYEKRVIRLSRTVGEPAISRIRALVRATRLSGVYKLSDPDPVLFDRQPQHRRRRCRNPKLVALGGIS